MYLSISYGRAYNVLQNLPEDNAFIDEEFNSGKVCIHVVDNNKEQQALPESNIIITNPRNKQIRQQVK